MEREVVLTRSEIPALLVPSGDPVTIPADTFVTLTQSLGGSFSAVHAGNLVRIEGRHAEALGKQRIDLAFEETAEGEVSKANVEAALREVYDPEIPVNIVDLGLIYDVRISKQEQANRVEIQMTLTAPGCGMGPVIADDVRFKVSQVPNVDIVEVELVFDPPWSNDRMSDEARLELGML